MTPPTNKKQVTMKLIAMKPLFHILVVLKIRKNMNPLQIFYDHNLDSTNKKGRNWSDKTRFKDQIIICFQ